MESPSEKVLQEQRPDDVKGQPSAQRQESEQEGRRAQDSRAQVGCVQDSRAQDICAQDERIQDIRTQDIRTQDGQEASKQPQSSPSKKRICVTLGTAHFKEANEQVRKALAQADVIELKEVYAQRYLGCTMPQDKRLEIYGTPGNDMACYMDGGDIEVFGNAQDQIGNTMDGGRVVIHGRCGDAAGYAMRGGKIFVRDDCGWRVGIHMKQYEDKCPTIVIGGNAGSFLGEYMAGGIIVLLGRPGEYLATGMHGGTIYLKERPDALQVPLGLVLDEPDEQDLEILKRLLEEYRRHFASDLADPVDTSGRGFCRLRPASSRPYASMYAN